MSGTLIINGLMIFFTVTTIAVIAYPLVKLLPSWLERSVYRKVAFHSDAFAAIEVALARPHNAPEYQARLTAQHDYHRKALAALAPGHPAPAAAEPTKVDAAA